MTTVDFPFYTFQDDQGAHQFTDARFRFTIRTTREMEKAAGCGVGMLQMRMQSVEVVVLLVCYGLRWDDKKMTEDKAVDLVERYLDAGGDVIKLSTALVKCLNTSGVYGKPDTDAGSEGDANPPKTTPTSATTTVN